METVVFKKKAPRKALKKRPRSEIPDASNSSESDDDIVHKQARVKTQGMTYASGGGKAKDGESSVRLEYTGDRTASSRNINDATREAADIDGRDEPKTDLSTLHPDIASVVASSEKANAKVGPKKAPANVRAISVVDYQPDICKDYKQTGFCGFGDTCKFLHDRGDFTGGWKLDRDWEDVKKTKTGGNTKELNPELDGIPFKCVICKNDYTNPIITKCGHYFCEKCAVQRYKKIPTCAQCGVGTGGLFSGAKKLKDLLQRRSAQAPQAQVT